MVSSETYQDIQKWIGQQLEYEATHSAPAPLTDVQRKLLEKLKETLPPSSPPPPEPSLGDPSTNWIGILMEDRAARQRRPGNVTGADFVEIPGPMVNNVQTWYVEVRIDEHPTPFPNDESGYMNGMRPSFTRKKDAKRYAAKSAVVWLSTNGYMSPPHGEGNDLASSQVQVQVQNRPATPQTLSPERKRQKLSLPSPEQNKGSSPTSKVVEEVRGICCDRLGQPEPKYIITESTEQPGFFSGHADMGILAAALPIGAGHVKEVLGKKLAKEKIAEELLVHLRTMAAKHDEEDRRFVQSLPPPIKQASEHNPLYFGELRG